MKNLKMRKNGAGLISAVVSKIDLKPENLPGGFPIKGRNDRKIVQFYNRYNLWVFDYANVLATGSGLDRLDEAHRANLTGNAGFAVLTLLNAYFDTIGQLSGKDTEDCFAAKDKNGKLKPKPNWAAWDAGGTKPTSEQCIWFGLTFVFREHLQQIGVNPATDVTWAEACQIFYKQSRSGIAHIGFPGGTIIFIPQSEHTESKYHQPLTWGNYKKKPTIAINWIEWSNFIRKHFDDYILRLRTATRKSPDWDLRKRFLTRIDRIG
jgi:hypothetical protein